MNSFFSFSVSVVLKCTIAALNTVCYAALSVVVANCRDPISTSGCSRSTAKGFLRARACMCASVYVVCTFVHRPSSIDGLLQQMCQHASAQSWTLQEPP